MSFGACAEGACWVSRNAVVLSSSLGVPQSSLSSEGSERNSEVLTVGDVKCYSKLLSMEFLGYDSR